MDANGEDNDRVERGLPCWPGLLVLCAVMLLFLALTSCQPDFFRDISLIF